MKCKFKPIDPEQPNFCQVIHGECQFIAGGYEDGHDCPILMNYGNFYNYWLEENGKNSSPAKVNYVKVDDEKLGTVDCEVDVLDIKLDNIRI